MAYVCHPRTWTVSTFRGSGPSQLYENLSLKTEPGEMAQGLKALAALPVFDSKHPHSGSQLYVIPVPGI